ncbi:MULTISPECIES: hypothetical protein [Sorangium]|uniref:Copper type II ascorbate-dependent monooxygenase C-terminal domain-containing protein n=1 Tax=Sorangium cellulosum (strain So ce56) TaxID=448385 RepID=A9FNS9_SORC5|nr:hypothetical protein [Sorangium cellulosum]CAN98453.1 hypothetical protein predicted by Glimmer/Critica [Sorangium cellulosum So ce56]
MAVRCLTLGLLPVVLGIVACVDGGGGGGGTPAPVDESLLDVPPVGQGFQMQTEETEVPAGVEQQDCYFFKVSELAASNGLDPTAPVNLHRVQIAQRDGSHHMNIFRVKTVKGLGPEGGLIQKNQNGVGECFKSPNWADWPLIANSQQNGQVDWEFPEGVANVLAPDEWLMLQTHYVNATSQKTPEAVGRVRVNFWALPAAEVKAEMGTVFATKQSIRVCQSNPTPTFEGSCQINSPSPVRIIGANGHFHSRGTRFDMYTWDGKTIGTPPASDRFYTSNAWDDPPMLISPELDRELPTNGGVWYGCTYEWQQPDPSVGCKGLDEYDVSKNGTAEESLDCCYTFGPIVEKNEHCNIFVYYYPKQTDVFCN